jgi:SAM-dependent methyltransferase
VDRSQLEALALKTKPKSAASAWGGDRELEAGSRAHYDDAAYYSRTYARRADDIAFYVGLAGRPCRVLEYGTGNGRIALPLARAGHQVTGVDLSRPMLDDFESRLAKEPAEVRRRVKLRQGDMRHLRLGPRFDLVLCTFNTFLHLYTRVDVEQFLARVKAHLAPGGRFALDVSIPSASEMARDPNHAYYCPPFRYPSTGEMVKYTERFDYDALRQVLFVSMEFAPEPRQRVSWMTPLAHSQFYPRELESLLHYNGFAIGEAYGGYKRGKLDRYSEEMVLVCRSRSVKRRPRAARSGR